MKPRRSPLRRPLWLGSRAWPRRGVASCLATGAEAMRGDGSITTVSYIGSVVEGRPPPIHTSILVCSSSFLVNFILILDPKIGELFWILKIWWMLPCLWSQRIKREQSEELLFKRRHGRQGSKRKSIISTRSYQLSKYPQDLFILLLKSPRHADIGLLIVYYILYPT